MNCNMTYEELAAFASGDLDAGREAEIRNHLEQCDTCRKRLEALNEADAALRALRPVRPPASAILATRRALGEAADGAGGAEIMTLDEVGEYLRVTPKQLGEVVGELPAFELAGRIRVRRTKLIEWIEQRERSYTRRAAASWAARAVRGEFGKGVA